MILNLKVLALALVAAAAFSAVSASVVSAATGRLTSDGPVTLSGANNAGTVNAFTKTFGTLWCVQYKKYERDLPGNNRHERLRLRVALTRNNSYPGRHLWCSGNNRGLPGWKTHRNHRFSDTGHLFPVCHFLIEQNATGYLGLDATDTTNGKIDLTGTATGIKASRSGIGCSTSTTEAVKLDFNVLFEGKNSKGEATAIGLSHL